MMKGKEERLTIGILGGGPAGLFMFKRLVESGRTDLAITIFERKDHLGWGMPYGPEGASEEHITNVSDNEIPEIVSSMQDWLPTAPGELLKRFDITPQSFNEYKVVPRLLFGEYLSAQFELLLQKAKKSGIETIVLFNTTVTDIADEPGHRLTKVTTAENGYHRFDAVVICTGHNWPKKHEGTVPNYFDSPYPPSKLSFEANYPVAIRGASLTAIDGVRTLARANGSFVKKQDGSLRYELAESSPDFRLVMHSINGLLPAIRFHLEDSHLSKDAVLSEAEVQQLMEANDGFVPLDYLFEKIFKEPIRQQRPQFYDTIKDMRMEEFVEHMMGLREQLDAFQLFKAEYAEAEKSIRRRESVYWKEELAVLSFAMNYPAKHFSAEDMLRLKKTLMPLISLVIAFVPQSSCRELLALHDAGILSLVSVDRSSKVEPQEEGGAVYEYTDEEGQKKSVPYKLFVDCLGQPQFEAAQFPFKTLLEDGSISPARIKFRSAEGGEKEAADNDKVKQDATGDWWMDVPGITINDNFQVLDKFGAYNERLYIMAVPYIGGYNPDYSGLDFCEAASAKVIKALLPDAVVSEE